MNCLNRKLQFNAMSQCLRFQSICQNLLSNKETQEFKVWYKKYLALNKLVKHCYASMKFNTTISLNRNVCLWHYICIQIQSICSLKICFLLFFGLEMDKWIFVLPETRYRFSSIKDYVGIVKYRVYVEDRYLTYLKPKEKQKQLFFFLLDI